MDLGDRLEVVEPKTLYMDDVRFSSKYKLRATTIILTAYLCAARTKRSGQEKNSIWLIIGCRSTR